MSYDLMVFDKEQTPNNKETFLQWYDEQTKWAELHDYATISVTTPALQKMVSGYGGTFLQYESSG